MPKRFCQCQGCQACGQHAGSHSALFDADLTRTLKCPPCQNIATQRRNARPSSTTRGYDTEHRNVREQLLARFRTGDPCALCGEPMISKDNLDLAHNENRDGWKGLAHARCNRATNKR